MKYSVHICALTFETNPDPRPHSFPECDATCGIHDCGRKTYNYACSMAGALPMCRRHYREETAR